MHPIPGTVYSSRSTPLVRVLVSSVRRFEGGDFLVQTSPERMADDAIAIGHEFTGDEWAALCAHFELQPE
ncbi:MAG: hypothetical protein PHU46_03585 [Rhodocyclaceae bacterium]|nr:hypothetical protein [Rhodocyclaceae bacterium]